MVKKMKMLSHVNMVIALSAVLVAGSSLALEGSQRAESREYGPIRIYFVPFSTQTLKGIGSKEILEQHDMTSLMKRSHDLLRESLNTAELPCTIDPGQIRLRIDGLDDEPILVDRVGCVLRRGVDRKLTDSGFKRLQFAFYAATPRVADPYER